jgi:hypothetical protein
MKNIAQSIRELDVARYNTVGILTSTNHRIGIQYIFDTFGCPVNLDHEYDDFRNNVYQGIVDIISIHLDIEEQKKFGKKADPREYKKRVDNLLESVVTPANLKYVEIALAVAVNYGSQYIVRDIFKALDQRNLQMDLNSYGFLRIGCYPSYQDNKRNKDFEKCASILLFRGCDPDLSRFSRFEVQNKNPRSLPKQFIRNGEVFYLQKATLTTMPFRELIKRSLKIQIFPFLYQEKIVPDIDVSISNKSAASTSLNSVPAWTNGRVTIQILTSAINVRVNISEYKAANVSK